MARRVTLKLQPSETAVFEAASRIFAGHIAAGHVTNENEAEMMEKSLRNAIRLAQQTDEAIRSDDEMA
jgi:hypothetical protein